MMASNEPGEEPTKYNRYDVRYHNNSSCRRPNHENDFIPVNKFSGSHIETFCQETRLLPLIEAIIKLCVRIKVKCVSVDRHQENNNNSLKVGSGTILGTNLHTNEVEICTAKHVVENPQEAGETICRLYFDGPKSQMVEFSGSNVVDLDDKKDWCRFICKVDAVEEMEKIRTTLGVYKSEYENVKRNKMSRKKKFIIISHPHGCYKYMSMGDQISEKDGFVTYDTPTCKGSSGGYIIPVGYRTKGVYVHRGTIMIDGVKRGCSSGEIEVYRVSQ
ncbi:hypothetical protein Btru_062808 [Bulinus truncatus]|nr:hypothetical protein Btru_062808 [Bulinus truncatus]